MHLAAAIAFIGFLIFLAHLFAGIFQRTRIPDVLWLLLIGILLGPVFHLLTPGQLGVVGPAFTTITLILILFESGLNLRFARLRTALPGTLALSICSFILVTLLVAGAAWLWTPLGAWGAVLLGLMLAGNSPTVVVPLTAGLGLESKTQDILFLESALGDVLSIVAALALMDFRSHGLSHWAVTGRNFLLGFGLALVLGALAAFFWSLALNRMRRMENAIFTTPAFVFILYGGSELLHLNGAMAALAFGIVLGNLDRHKPLLVSDVVPIVGLNETERIFFAEIIFLLKTFFFVYIGLSVEFTHPAWVAMGLVFSGVILLARIPAVRLTLARRLPAFDAEHAAAMIPKGLAAAVLASIMLQQHVHNAGLLQNVTYSVILFSIILTSILVFILSHGAARRGMGWLIGARSNAQDEIPVSDDAGQ